MLLLESANVTKKIYLRCDVKSSTPCSGLSKILSITFDPVFHKLPPTSDIATLHILPHLHGAYTSLGTEISVVILKGMHP
jgi:hypothetical protein